MIESAGKPASHALQESHDSYRRVLTSAISRNFCEVARSCPEVAVAARDYDAFLSRNPSKSFRLVGLDDLETTISSGDGMFLK